MRLQATALSGFGLLFGVSFAGSHSVLLQIVVLAIHGEKETMSPKELNFKHFHGPQSVPCVIGPPDRDTQKSGVILMSSKSALVLWRDASGRGFVFGLIVAI